jgi:hypothetical protein
MCKLERTMLKYYLECGILEMLEIGSKNYYEFDDDRVCDLR